MTVPQGVIRCDNMNDLKISEYKYCWTREINDDSVSNRLIVDTRGVRARNLSIFEPEYELLVDEWEDSQLE